MTHVLLKFTRNFEDEFNLFGMKMMKASEWEDVKSMLEDSVSSFPAEYWFGTNEHLVFDDADDYYESIEVTSISKKTHDILFDITGESYGNFPNILELME